MRDDFSCNSTGLQVSDKMQSMSMSKAIQNKPDQRSFNQMKIFPSQTETFRKRVVEVRKAYIYALDNIFLYNVQYSDM